MADEDWRARALKAEATLAQIETATHTPDGVQEYLHRHDPDEVGAHPDCPACWVHTIRWLMGVTDPERLPAYAIPIRRVDGTTAALFPVQDHHLPGNAPDLLDALQWSLDRVKGQQRARSSVPRTEEEVLGAVEAGDTDALVAWLEDEVVPGVNCHAGKDGECGWMLCPQTRDGEPAATGRHCPIDRQDDDQ